MYFFSNYCCRYVNVISILIFEVSIWVIYLELFIVYMANFFVMHDIINMYVVVCRYYKIKSSSLKYIIFIFDPLEA